MVLLVNMINVVSKFARCCSLCKVNRSVARLEGNERVRTCVTETNQSPSHPNDPLKKLADISGFPKENIRNFSIIAHIDHGKSTLADRLLEITGTIPSSVDNEQVLDKLPVERERGITVKAQTASLFYEYKGISYLLNLIDTPGHVDFSYEVARSLTACQGVVLLVDANQGIQAQTMANFYLAFAANLVIIPVLNKIDLKNAKPEMVSEQITNVLEIMPEEILKISAKLGTGVEELIHAIIERIPVPHGDSNKPLRAFLFDSWYDRYRGVIAFVAIIDGKVKPGNTIQSIHTKKMYQVQSLGIMHPEETLVTELCAGQVGYIVANIRSSEEAQIGDTFHLKGQQITPLPGFKLAKPMVFAGIFPVDQTQHVALRNAIKRLTLNDSSVSVNLDSSPALGQGWRLGFLGLLHMDVFNQRLEQEYDAQVVVTAPSVPYKARIFGEKNIKEYGEEMMITNPTLFPDPAIVSEYFEPMVTGTIITPDKYIGGVMSLCMDRRGVQKESVNIDNTNVMLQFKLPLNEIIVDFFDELKRLSSGYASFDYEECGYDPAPLTKLIMLLNGNEVEELTTIVHTKNARLVGRRLCERLKEIVPRQQFDIAIQAAIGGKVIARETIKALRKDVVAKLYGGDVTRRMKLLARQSEGKKRMRMVGNIEMPRDTFIQVLRRSKNS